MSVRAQRRSTSLQLLINLFIVTWFIVAAFPFIWTVWGSFKVELDFFSIANWTDALTGERTKAAYDRPFTGAGYQQFPADFFLLMFQRVALAL